MAAFWPTPSVAARMLIVAERMKRLPKVVFSRTRQEVSWSNTTVVSGDIAREVRRMKAEPGPDMAILGSGSVVAQLAPEGAIDEYQIVVNPLVLGRGRTMFGGIRGPLTLRRSRPRTFGNGSVLLRCAPVT
jgi:dihydrofolate reductase